VKQEEEGFAAGLRPGLVVLHKVSDTVRALQLRWISLHEKDSINAEAFMTVRRSGSIAWQECMVGHRATLQGQGEKPT